MSGSSFFADNSGLLTKVMRIAKHFDRDPETNEVLWFSAPPLNVARSPAPKQSLAYLHFLAMKRKQEQDPTHNEGIRDPDAMDVDGEPDSTSHKRRKTAVRPTVTETMTTVFIDMTAQASRL